MHLPLPDRETARHLPHESLPGAQRAQVRRHGLCWSCTLVLHLPAATSCCTLVLHPSCCTLPPCCTLRDAPPRCTSVLHLISTRHTPCSNRARTCCGGGAMLTRVSRRAGWMLFLCLALLPSAAAADPIRIFESAKLGPS